MGANQHNRKQSFGRHIGVNAAFASLMLVAACSSKVVAPVATEPPTELTAPCDPAQPVPAAPPRIRTADQLAKAYDATDVARARNGVALLKCRAQLQRLYDWIEGQIAR